MIFHASSLGFNFHIPVDFGSNILFPHIFTVLHRISVETVWFSLVMHDKSLMDEISMQSCLDSRISMLLPPVWRRAHLRSQKKIKNPLGEIRAFEVFGFRCIVTGPRGRSEAMLLRRIRPVQSDGVVRNFTQHFHQALRTGWFSSSGILYTCTGSGKIVCTGTYRYILVHTCTCQYRIP